MNLHGQIKTAVVAKPACASALLMGNAALQQSRESALLTPSDAAQVRMLASPREPLFFANWLNVVMIHLEVEPRTLSVATPFELDLWEGRAFVTLVAFTLDGMRPRFGGSLTRMLFKPLASHHFLNVRTYVRQGNETGIHFLAEWLDSRLAVVLGPRVFSLPYRYGHVSYQNTWAAGTLSGSVVDDQTGTTFGYRADTGGDAARFAPCAAGSLDEWLMERYTAFNCGRGRRRFFRVWHEPWPQVRVKACLAARGLLASRWPFMSEAQLIGAHYSPGVRAVWMGWPHKL